MTKLDIQHTNQFTKLVQLKSRNYVVISDNDELIFIDNQLSKTHPVSSSGRIVCHLAIKDNLLALGHKQTILILECDKNYIKTMLKGYNEIYLSMAYLPDKDLLVSSTNKLQIRVWDVKKARNFKLYTEGVQSGYNILKHSDGKYLGVDLLHRKVQTFELPEGEGQKVNILHTVEGGMKSVQKVYTF